jgi:hypothetical protein
MKRNLIEEILSPLDVVLDNLKDPDDIAHLKLAINKVRVDLSEFLGDVFEPDDSYYDDPAFMAGIDDNDDEWMCMDDESWMKGPS